MSPLILLTLSTIGMFSFKYLRFLGHPPHPLVLFQDALRHWRWEVLEVSGDLPRFQIQESKVPPEAKMARAQPTCLPGSRPGQVTKASCEVVILSEVEVLQGPTKRSGGL